MSTFIENADALFQGEGPDGEPPADPPSPDYQRIAELVMILWWLEMFILWKMGHPVAQPNLNEEPWATWEAGWNDYIQMQPGEMRREMAADGHVARYPE